MSVLLCLVPEGLVIFSQEKKAQNGKDTSSLKDNFNKEVGEKYVCVKRQEWEELGRITSI